MKKLLMGLGTLGAMVTPIASVVACGDTYDPIQTFTNTDVFVLSFKLGCWHFDSSPNDMDKRQPQIYMDKDDIKVIKIPLIIKNENPDSTTKEEIESRVSCHIDGELVRLRDTKPESEWGTRTFISNWWEDKSDNITFSSLIPEINSQLEGIEYSVRENCIPFQISSMGIEKIANVSKMFEDGLIHDKRTNDMKGIRWWEYYDKKGKVIKIEEQELVSSEN